MVGQEQSVPLLQERPARLAYSPRRQSSPEGRYRGSSFNAQAFFSAAELNVAKPETIDAAEGGFKSRLLGGALQLSSAVFHYWYKNQQMIDIDPVAGTQLLVNLPKSRIFGAEIEFAARLTRALTLSGGLGLLDTRIEAGTLQGTSLVGNELPNAPSATLTLAADWTLLSQSWGTAIAHVSGSFAGDQWFEAHNKPRLKQEAYALVNARLTARALDGGWEASIWTKNLLNKFYYTGRLDMSNYGYDYNMVGEPRTYGLSATYRFGG